MVFLNVHVPRHLSFFLPLDKLQAHSLYIFPFSEKIVTQETAATAQPVAIRISKQGLDRKYVRFVVDIKLFNTVKTKYN